VFALITLPATLFQVDFAALALSIPVIALRRTIHHPSDGASNVNTCMIQTKRRLKRTKWVS